MINNNLTNLSKRNSQCQNCGGSSSGSHLKKWTNQKKMINKDEPSYVTTNVTIKSSVCVCVWLWWTFLFASGHFILNQTIGIRKDFLFCSWHNLCQPSLVCFNNLFSFFILKLKLASFKIANRDIPWWWLRQLLHKHQHTCLTSIDGKEVCCWAHCRAGSLLRCIALDWFSFSLSSLK